MPSSRVMKFLCLMPGGGSGNRRLGIGSAGAKRGDE